MLKISLIVLGVIGSIATIAAVFLLREPSAPRTGDEEEVRTLVEDFGKALQGVSLSQKDALAETLKEQYGPYLSSGLLTEWMNEPRKALGRQASDHWPDRIDITKVSGGSGTSYTVRGDVVEVTNEGGDTVETARRPIVLVLKKENSGEWHITMVTVGPYPGDGDWILSLATPSGMQYLYPDPLPTQFIAPRAWPPIVEVTAGEFGCTEASVAATDETMTATETKQHTVGDRVYCVTITAKGEEKNIDRTYEYVTVQGDSLARVAFTLRFPECRNYPDASRRDACLLERTTFDIDGLADRIAQSIRTP